VIFVIRAGRMAATIGDQEVRAGQGDVVIVSPSTGFCLRNASASESVSATEAASVITAGVWAIIDGTGFPRRGHCDEFLTVHARPASGGLGGWKCSKRTAVR
jgi:hypothetical protein